MREREQEQRFLEVYDMYADAIFRYCYYRVYDRERARDIMQEAFCRAWKHSAEGNEVKNMRALVYRIATNLIIDLSRKKKEQSLEMMEEQGFQASSNPTAALHQHIDMKPLLALLATLAEPYQRAVYMRYIDELRPKEIAHILGISTTAVSVRIYRGVRMLRRLARDRNIV